MKGGARSGPAEKEDVSLTGARAGADEHAECAVGDADVVLCGEWGYEVARDAFWVEETRSLRGVAGLGLRGIGLKMGDVGWRIERVQVEEEDVGVLEVEVAEDAGEEGREMEDDDHGAPILAATLCGQWRRIHSRIGGWTWHDIKGKVHCGSHL